MEIYKDAKAMHKIQGPIPVLLIKDKTKDKVGLLASINGIL